MNIDPPNGLPGQLNNLVCAFHRNLRPVMAKPFLETLEKQIEPWPGTYEVARAEGQITHDGGVCEGVDYIGYLDPLWRYFALALLVDPEIGVLAHAQSAADRDGVIGLAKLLQRSLRGDFPSDEEWKSAGGLEGDGEEKPLSEIQSIVSFSILLGSGYSSSGLDMMAIQVARFWKRKPVPAWAKQPIGEPEGCLTALKLWPLRLLARWLVQKPDGGNPLHYQAQAHWLLRALSLRWPPHEPAETELFRSLLRGDLSALPKYGQCLKAAGVEPKAINQMAGTIRKLVGLLDPL